MIKMSVVISALYVFVCCSKLVASIPFPEEFVRKYLAAANGEPVLTGIQQTGINPSQGTAYAGQINNAHSQPIYPSIPNAANYYPPLQNVGLNFTNNYDRGKYADVSAQASAQAGNVYPQMINPNLAWEQEFYRNKLLQQINGQNVQQIPFNEHFITKSQIPQANTNPPMNIQQIQKDQIFKQNAAGFENNQDFSTLNNIDEIRRRHLNSAVKNEQILRTNTQQQEIQQQLMNNPNIQNIISKTKLKKRYLVVHPDGTVNHVDSLDEVIRENPNYVLLNSGRIKASHLSSINTQATAPTTVTNTPETKPSDIKQFRVTEVTSATKKTVLPKVHENASAKSSNLEKRIIPANKKGDGNEKIVSVKSKASDSPIKVSVKSNKNGDVEVTNVTPSSVSSKAKNKVQKVSIATSSKTASKPSVKFSVKESSKSVKKDNKGDVKEPTASNTASEKVIIPKNKDTVASEIKLSSSPKKRTSSSTSTTATTSSPRKKNSAASAASATTSSSPRKSNSASSSASASTAPAEKNKKDSKYTPKPKVNSNKVKTDNQKAKSTIIDATANKNNEKAAQKNKVKSNSNKVKTGNQKAKSTIIDATANKNNEKAAQKNKVKSNSNKVKTDNQKAKSTVIDATANKNNEKAAPKNKVRSKKVIATSAVASTPNKNGTNKKVIAKSSSLDKSDKPKRTEPQLSEQIDKKPVNGKSNVKVTKHQNEQEKQLKVIPVIKGKSTNSAPRTSSVNPKNQNIVGKGKSTKTNSIVGNNDSALRTNGIDSNNGNVFLMNSSKTKDSNEDTDKMMELIKGIGKDELKDKVLILLVMPPIVDRELHTTIYPDGTIIDEITETTWDSDDEDAEPNVVTRTKVRHVNDPPTNED